MIGRRDLATDRRVARDSGRRGAGWRIDGCRRARRTPRRTQPATADVVVAAMDLPFGTKIEARRVGMIKMLRGSEPSGAYREPKPSKASVARASLLHGEILARGSVC